MRREGEAEDGEEVVELCQTKEPDLVIMDLILPLFDGANALLKIRSNISIKQPKVIFCSSIIDPIRIKQALDSGADEYIMKPFDEDIIISKLTILGLR